METSVDEILRQEYDQSIQDIDDIDLSNLCESSEEENKTDQFKESEERVEKFTETLFPIFKKDQNINSLRNTIFFNIRYFLGNKTDICGSDDLKWSINNNFLFNDLYENSKYKLVLDYRKFNANYHEINSMLAKHGYFLRIFELRQKFRYFSLQSPKKQTVVQQLSICISEKYNGFHVISTEYCDKLQKKFRPIDIIYKPVKSIDAKILCYYSTDLSKAYRNSCGETAKKVSHGYAFECYYCSKFFVREDRQKRHIESCSSVPGVVYNFNNQDLVTFEDNFKSKGDLSFALYFDFETTASTDNYFDPEQTKIFVVSYALIACFYLKLKIQ